VAEGYLDYTRIDGGDLLAQPRLLYQFANHLQTGVEWYWHRSDIVAVSAPQWMIKWAF
jgi:hypothetical protein